MKSIFFISFCVLLLSCSSKKQTTDDTLTDQADAKALDLTKYSRKNIKLINQLGILSFYLPDDMDTFITYTDIGEYHCGETQQYRFTSKKFNVDHTTAVNYSDSTDTLYQLTIIQTYNKDCESHTVINDSLLNMMRQDKSRIYSMMEDRGAKFIVSEVQGKKKNLDMAEITALTSIDGRPITFLFQCYKRSAEDFRDKMLTSLKTIEVKQPKEVQSAL